MLDKERTERKRHYLLKQEKRTLAKRYAIETKEANTKMRRRIELERRHIERVKNELQKNTEVELEKMKQLEERKVGGLNSITL